jgi:hypothetical protein
VVDLAFLFQLGNEITAQQADWREQWDASTEHPLPTEHDPLYYNLLAPNQWPNPAFLPNFRPIFQDYIARMGDVSFFFTSLIAEAIGLPANALDQFFDKKGQQHKLKIIKVSFFFSPESGFFFSFTPPYLLPTVSRQRHRRRPRRRPPQGLHAHQLPPPSHRPQRSPSAEPPWRMDRL